MMHVVYRDGTRWTSRNATSYVNGDYLKISLENPVLSSIFNIRASYLSKFRFYVENTDGSKDFDHESLSVIKQPNIYQTTEDFLFQFEWMRCAYGWVYQKPFGAKNFAPNALYNLSPSKIDFIDNKGLEFLVWRSQDVKNNSNLSFNYLDNNTQKEFKFSEVMPFYDIANGLTDEQYSQYKSPSRIDGVLKQISNINLAAEAENRVLPTNGREAIFSKEFKDGTYIKGAQELSDDNRKDILHKLNTKYSLNGGTRTIVPNQPLEHLDMSINSKNLGLHESIINNAGLVVKAYELNNAIYKYFLKGDTFDNQDASEVRFLQNVMQPVADNLCATWTKSFGDINKPFKATIEHLPTMQVVEDKKAEKAFKISQAIRNLVQSGYTLEQAQQFMVNLGITDE